MLLFSFQFFLKIFLPIVVVAVDFIFYCYCCYCRCYCSYCCWHLYVVYNTFFFAFVGNFILFFFIKWTQNKNNNKEKTKKKKRSSTETLLVDIILTPQRRCTDIFVYLFIHSFIQSCIPLFIHSNATCLVVLLFRAKLMAILLSNNWIIKKRNIHSKKYHNSY